MKAPRRVEPTWRRALRLAGVPIERPNARIAKRINTETVFAWDLPCGASFVSIYDDAYDHSVKVNSHGVDRRHAEIVLERIVAGLLEAA